VDQSCHEEERDHRNDENLHILPPPHRAHAPAGPAGPGRARSKVPVFFLAAAAAMRKLKFHEQKLLKKVNFYDYKREKNLREVKILRKYHIQKREDYMKYV
jgi:hypothetical protein